MKKNKELKGFKDSGSRGFKGKVKVRRKKLDERREKENKKMRN
jgi:hypothetical protein